MRNSPIEVITTAGAARNARALMAAVAQIAPCSGWVFARFSEDGEVDELVANVLHVGQAAQVEIVAAEREAQNAAPDILPRITSTRTAVAPYRNGVTLVFGRRRRINAMMLLLRSDQEIAFSDAEMEALGGSLDTLARAVAESSTGNVPDEADAHLRLTQRTPPALYVLRRDLSIEYYYEPESSKFNFVNAETGRLSSVIEDAVRSMTADWHDERQSWKERSGMPLPLVAVRTYPLAHGSIIRIGVSVERFGARNSLAWAAQRYAISSRELQVLTLILQGMGTPEIAARLQIAESTAHDHIKRMLLKTKARNRAEMVAKALGWHAERPG